MSRLVFDGQVRWSGDRASVASVGGQRPLLWAKDSRSGLVAVDIVTGAERWSAETVAS